MPGISLAFPSLLQDHGKGLSTMRIVVFMTINILCLLLLKIGWNAISLAEIGIDANWVAIIAFVFGAKATQAYFESKNIQSIKKNSNIGVAGLYFSNAEIAKLAVEQNQQYLRVKFPNIISISDAVDDLEQSETHVVTIYIKDSNTLGIPERLPIKMFDGTIKTINTEIIENVGDGTIQCDQYDYIQTKESEYEGSICCMAKTIDEENVIVTSGHIYSELDLINFGGWLNKHQAKEVKLNGEQIIGTWIFQKITNIQDVAFIGVDDGVDFHSMMKFGDTGYYNATDDSVKKEEVTLISNKNEKRDGYLLDHKTVWPVNYGQEQQYKSNIIIVGSSKDRKN